ncbi:MAG: TetR/AcrR family transcriptional regulator [Solirubrobacterales bacterium]
MTTLPPHLAKTPVGRDPLPREVIESHQRERVLEAAIGVFAKRGYPSTTIDHIVAAARIGVGSFYALFDGKEDCFSHVFERVVDRGRERVVGAIPADASWEDQALAALRALLDLIADEPHAARIALVEVQTAGPDSLLRYEELLESLTPVLRAARQLSPVGAELPETFEDATVAGVAWLLHQRLVAGEVEDLDELLPDLVGILIEPYVGEKRAAALLVA